MFYELKAVPIRRQWGRPNADLDKAIEGVKSKYPHMFLQEHELKERCFYDEPDYAIPLKSFLVPAPGRRLPRKKK